MTDITVTLDNPPELDSEERRLRALRAREVLGSAGWVFDECISNLTCDLIGTNPAESQKRETLYHQIYAATQLKRELHRIIEQQQAEETVNEQRERRRQPDAE